MVINNKKILIIFLVILGVILFSTIIFYFSRLPTTTKQISTVPVIPSGEVTGAGLTQPIETDISGLSNKVSDSTSQKEKDKIVSILPINVQNFQTSVGITTNFNIFSIASDPSQVIHIEIYGINYYLSDPTTDNPQATAFVESFNEVKRILSGKGIDLNNLQIIYGTRDYIQKTAENWIKYFKLLP